jgi:aryl-alcohol dehydrogenase-like predicted oxidoreductase
MQRRRMGGPDGIEVSGLCLGALAFGTYIDEKTSFAILDRFVEAGGSFIDTADNYCFWEAGRTGHESERVLGHWLQSRGVRDQVQLATKAGAQPTVPGTGLETAEGLSGPVIRDALAGSLRRLGTDRVDLFYAHMEDRSVPLEETVGAMDELVRDGATRLVGVSNHPTWRIERARALAAATGRTPYTCIQQRYSYLQPRFDRALPQTGHVHTTDELLDYVRSEPDLTLITYSALLAGAYTRPEKPIPDAYDHPGTPPRMAALREVAAELGASVNQVVIAWLTGHTPALLPVVGFTSLDQLNEIVEAMDLTLSESQRTRLDTAGRDTGVGAGA